MLVAVQGCCHGSLDTIYASIAKFESRSNQKVRLLLLCGDFQALRSVHDYQSLAVPAKYRSLGTFHEYYRESKIAPILTLVIGGNHEASNYMWELYHGGWLAENIYYIGGAGSVIVDGVRIVGSSGIYNAHNYGKGHFEKVPFDGSQLRSVYHTRQYDIAKLMQLPSRPHTIFMSHDWPTTIPNHGDTADLLRRKPFFKSEVQTNTLGSPPLLNVLRHIQPEHWFAAHLHVKFAAVYEHHTSSSSNTSNLTSNGLAHLDHLGGSMNRGMENPDEITTDDDEDIVLASGNPDEIAIEEDDEDLEDHLHQHALHEADLAGVSSVPSGNPDEIDIEDDFDDPTPADDTLPAPLMEALEVDESVDLVEAARAQAGPEAVNGIIGSSSGSLQVESNGDPGPVTQARRLSGSTQQIPANHYSGQSVSSSTSTKFLALDKPGKGRDFLQFLDVPTPEPISPELSPRITFDPQWLAITRAFHPYLSTEIRQKPLPYPDEMDLMIRDELERIEREGLLVPKQEGSPTESELVWEKGPVDVHRVQRFSPTAPAQGQPGGDPNAWYTNPQTEAFCGMLGIENKINPAPR